MDAPTLHPHPRADVVPSMDPGQYNRLSAFGKRDGAGIAVVNVNRDGLGDRWHVVVMVMPEGYAIESKRPLAWAMVPAFLGVMCREAHVVTVEGWEGHNDAPVQPIGSSVYFIEATNGLIKIGKADSVPARMAGLQLMSPLGLRLLGHTPGGVALEHRLHRELDASRSHGEWFRPTSEVLAAMARFGVVA